MNIVHLSSFMLERIPGFRKWEPETFFAWLGWHMRGGEMIVMQDKDAICGIAIAHPIEKPEDAQTRYKTNDKGLYLCVDALFAKDKHHFRAMSEALRKRFYYQHYLIFSRSKHQNRYRTYKIDDFMKTLGCYKGYSYAG